MHEITYSPVDLPVDPGDETHATRTTVLPDSDADLDSDDESESDDEEQDESSYSSIARGS